MIWSSLSGLHFGLLPFALLGSQLASGHLHSDPLHCFLVCVVRSIFLSKNAFGASSSTSVEFADPALPLILLGFVGVAHLQGFDPSCGPILHLPLL